MRANYRIVKKVELNDKTMIQILKDHKEFKYLNIET